MHLTLSLGILMKTFSPALMVSEGFAAMVEVIALIDRVEESDGINASSCAPFCFFFLFF